MGLPETARQSLHPQVRSYIEGLESKLQSTEARCDAVESRYTALETRYDHLKEEYRLLLYKRFGRSSEKESGDEQPSLFEEAEVTADPEVVETGTVTVEKHTRPKRGRKPIDESVPRVDIVHDIPEEEKKCACEHQRDKIGHADSERRQVIPEHS